MLKSTPSTRRRDPRWRKVMSVLIRNPPITVVPGITSETGTAALVAGAPPRALDEVLVALPPDAVQRVLRRSRWSDRLRRRVVPRVVRVRVPDPGGHARRAALLGAVRAVVFPELVLVRAEADGPRPMRKSTSESGRRRVDGVQGPAQRRRTGGASMACRGD